VQLGFEPVRVLLFILEQLDEKIARAVVFFLRCEPCGLVVQGNGSEFECKVGLDLLGVPSRKKMRSISDSACFISSMDCFLMNFASRS
jgi:hypothetical protein